MTRFLLLLLLGITVISAKAQSYSWHSLPFGGGGFVTGLLTTEADDTLMYARTDVGGVYRWIASQRRWQPLMDWLPDTESGWMGVESMAIDPQHPNRLYLYVGTSYINRGSSALLYSEDYGKTMTRIFDPTALFPSHGNDYGRQMGERLAVSPNDDDLLLCGSRTRGLWRSQNGGRKWERVGCTNFPDDCKVSFVRFVRGWGGKAKKTVVIAGLMRKGVDNLFLSTDNGYTWKPLRGHRTDYMPHRSTVAPEALYITYTDSIGPSTKGRGGLMRLSLADGKWTDISPDNYSFGEVAVHPHHPDRLVVATLSRWNQQRWCRVPQNGDQIYTSTDGGKSWINLMRANKVRFVEPTVTWLQQSAQLHWAGSLALDRVEGNALYVISGNGIFHTDNIWASTPEFNMAVSGLEETVALDIKSVEGAPLMVAIGDYDGGLYHSPSDRSFYPSRFPLTMGNNYSCAIAYEAPHVMARVGNNRIMLSTDGGNQWIEMSSPLSVHEGRRAFEHCTLSSDGLWLIVTSRNKHPFLTTDHGATWTELTEVPTGCHLYADGQAKQRFFGLSNGVMTVYTLTDDGRVESKSSIKLAGADRRLTVVQGREGEILAACGSQGISRITVQADGTLQNQTLSQCTATCLGIGKAAPGKDYPSLYIWGRDVTSNPVGLYRSDDKGTTWVRINDDQHQFGGPSHTGILCGDMNVYGRVFMSTIGRGVVCGQLVK